MYYRVAIQMEPLPTWQWRSTVLSSLQTLFQFLRLYRAFPQDRLRVFSSSSYAEDVRDRVVLQRRACAGRLAVPTNSCEIPSGGGFCRADPVAGSVEPVRCVVPTWPAMVLEGRLLQRSE